MAAPVGGRPRGGIQQREPWLPVVGDAERLCVECQESDGRSMLTFVRRVAALRAQTAALQTGAQRALEVGCGVLAWLRVHGDDRILAAVNFADTPTPLHVGNELPRHATLLLSTDSERRTGETELDNLTLGPIEDVLLRCSPPR